MCIYAKQGADSCLACSYPFVTWFSCVKLLSFIFFTTVTFSPHTLSISVNFIYGRHPEHFWNTSRTFTEYLWNIYGIIIAIQDKSVNAFYPNIDNFNHRLTFSTIFLYFKEKICATFHFLALNYVQLSIKIYEKGENDENENCYYYK